MVQINILVESNKDKDSSRSILSKLFRNLMRINIIPLKWDDMNNQLNFKYFSKQFALYYLYVLAVSIFLLFCTCMFGFHKILNFWKILLFEENTTDMLTMITFNIFGVSQYSFFPIFCRNLTKISKDIVMNYKLYWPCHGTKVAMMTILNFFALNIFSSLMYMNLLETDIESIAWLMLGTIVSLLFNQLFQFIMYIYILTWLDYFSKFCQNFDNENINKHVKNCIESYKSLQDGLQNTFLICFSLLQVLIVINLYMAISSLFYGQTSICTNILMSICYFLMAMYNSTILYSVTTIAEKSYMGLQNLIIYLEQQLKLKQNSDEFMEIKILIRKIEHTHPLNGNGYFELKKGTITSIVSISVTYLVILLQFRAS